MLWNKRKNGNKSEYKFVDRYSKDGNPDDDFTDLDALVRNVANSIIREGTEKPMPEILGMPEARQIREERRKKKGYNNHKKDKWARRKRYEKK